MKTLSFEVEERPGCEGRDHHLFCGLVGPVPVRIKESDSNLITKACVYGSKNDLIYPFFIHVDYKK